MSKKTKFIGSDGAHISSEPVEVDSAGGLSADSDTATNAPIEGVAVPGAEQPDLPEDFQFPMKHKKGC